MKKLLSLLFIFFSLQAHALTTHVFTSLPATSMGATITTTSQIMDTLLSYSIQGVWTGSPVGDIKIQASNDCTNWDDITGTDQSISSAGSFLWNVTSLSYHCMRVLYTRVSGTGSLILTQVNRSQ